MATSLKHCLSGLALGLCLAIGTPVTTMAQELGHLRLVDRLDRPVDGYCLDILGVGETLRVDVPIFAHNCKPGLTPDSAVMMTSEGMIRFPAVDLCVTAAGVNGRALPGAAIILRSCDGRAAFFEASALQHFDFRDDGRLALRGTNLCLAVGTVSDTTYSTRDRWRVLSVEDCAATPLFLSQWEFNTGPFPSP
ncbi:MAG: hypothetical protein AAFX39_16310 [Pseudomonadota bacterium]